MSPHRSEPDPAPKTLEEAASRIVRLETWTKGLSGRMAKNEQLRKIALITAFLCMVAAGFGAGYAIHSREQANDANTALHHELAANAEQVQVNRVSTCASARSVALAFREPQISAAGIPEPRGHFLARMSAQRASLEAAENLDCESLPHFQRFTAEVESALAELTLILNPPH